MTYEHSVKNPKCRTYPKDLAAVLLGLPVGSWVIGNDVHNLSVMKGDRPIGYIDLSDREAPFFVRYD